MGIEPQGYSVRSKYATSVLSSAPTTLTEISLEKYFPAVPTGGDVYVLSIREATHTDTGLYVCEVNTDPPARSFHKLTGSSPFSETNLGDLSGSGSRCDAVAEYI